MRIRMTTLALALAGLLVAVAVGLAANSIASRSFTPGVDALPAAGSLAPPAAPGAKPVTTAKASTTPKPATKPKPATTVKPATTTTPKPATTPATTTDDHGGDRNGSNDSSGKGKSGSDDSSGHGSGHGSDD
jgi:hypothetical protein